ILPEFGPWWWDATRFCGAEGAKSNSVSVTPFQVSAPSAPQNLVASHHQGPNSGKIKLDWQAPASDGGAAVTGYKIYRGTSAGAETHVATVGNVLTYTDSGLTKGVTYHYKVSAVNSAGEGAKSNGASAVG
ncbi:MAG TPA: fibronectin type III domain-containing protein, partial [Candidatus Thermoplasmatota archaeon]|nr:fibronectin type III domain-containing protein [Candidatus Thermoplasmatota archaeon]